LSLLFNNDDLNCSKVTVKPYIKLQKFSLPNKCCFFKSWKKKTHHGFHKIVSSTTACIANMKKCFFVKDHVTLKTVLMTADKSALPSHE